MKKLLIKLAVACLTLVAVFNMGACTYRSEGSVIQDVNFEVSYKNSSNEDVNFDVTLCLYKTFAPKTCERILSLIKSDFYENTSIVFNRTGKYAVLGAYEFKDGEYSPLSTEKDSIKGEFTKNGYDSKLLPTAGTLVMLREPDTGKGGKKYDTAKVKFAILLEDVGEFSGEDYCVFGKIKYKTEGLKNLVAMRDELIKDAEGLYHVKYAGLRSDYDVIDFSKTFEYAYDDSSKEMFAYLDDGTKSLEPLQTEEGQKDYDLYTQLTNSSEYDFYALPNALVTVKNFKKV